MYNFSYTYQNQMHSRHGL